jgi:hypothetical protein
MKALSVIICTHNPRFEYLNRVLTALKSQTFPFSEWELLIIDNASDQVLSSEFDLTWHPNAKHIREEQLGLTPARLRGVQEAQTDLLIFVDDDNVLNSDYLEVALMISKDYPFLGAWGGQIKPEFETPPPEWTKPYWKFLAIREFEQNSWSNLLHQHDTTPCGAGLCIRKPVAEKYAEFVQIDSRRFGLDRKGKQLISCGDSDMAFTACDIGLGTGQFTSLELIHLMPAARLSEAYLVRLIEGITYSHTMLDSFRGKLPTLTKQSLLSKVLEFYRILKMTPREQRFYKAFARGKALAIQEILASHGSSTKLEETCVDNHKELSLT